MSREIKFRAWHSDLNEFVPAHKHFVVTKDGAISGAGNIHLMQYTGLKDKNGVEIYEGDICMWYINNIERLGEVYYHDQSFEMRSPSLGYIGWDANRGEVKVIGNIHQHPELLR